ncbi:MAG: hypothetical protein ABFE13_09480 [Phycisphaerales bacterium]
MFRTLFLSTALVTLGVFGLTRLASGAPLPSGSLKVGAVIDIGKELAAPNSMYNPRSFEGKNYVVQINAPYRAAGCYRAGWTTFEALADIGDGAESRMAGAFPSADYVLLAGGASNDYLSRIDPNLNVDTRVFATDLAVMPSSYDWVDDNTIIHNSYKSGLRANLYLTDIHPAPFQVAANTSWNANGYVTTGATTRIRNVRVGDIYRGYAYYGDSGVTNAGFWAIDLATGVSTQLGTIEATGDGSWGLWTVKEVDGFLYVHTTHDGVYVYRMTGATTLGTLHARYTKDKLDALAEDTNPNWGFDVVDGGARMLLSAGLGRVIEIIDSQIADDPNPRNGAVDVAQTPVLAWSPGVAAVSHDLYFGVDANAVNDANTNSPEYKGSWDLDSERYEPGTLEWNTTYYWRVDEVNDADPNSPWKGDVWSFTTADFLVVDDFEGYNDHEDEGTCIFQTWIDGVENGTSSYVGYQDSSNGTFGETSLVHGGLQSMPLNYDNRISPYYAQTDRTWQAAQDWTLHGVDTLTLHVRGSEWNDAAPLYVALEDAAGHVAVVNYGDDTVTQSLDWIEWRIPLDRFSGVDPAAVQAMHIGLGNRESPAFGGAGVLYVDDIRGIGSNATGF